MGIYFDHSATTPVDKRVMDAMEPYFTNQFGNPSSVHNFGQEAQAGVDAAREQVARFLNCKTDEVIFTSGATESNNLFLKGVVKAMEKEKGEKNNIHIITSSVEHKSILEPCEDLERKGVEVTYLPVDKKGLVSPDDVRESIKENTVLVSVMYVNSEVGSVQPVREIGKIVKKVNEDRYNKWQKEGARKQEPKPAKVYFHTDATQAANFFDCDVQRLHADFLSMSGHKIYGPKGVGVLFAREGSKLKAVQTGGGQERKMRSGTLNVTGIVGMGKAVSLLTPERQKGNSDQIAKLRDMLVNGIKDKIDDVHLTTDRKNGTPSHAHFIFKGAEGESVLLSLDLEGIAVSTGSACAAKDLHSSHVLNAMGVSGEDANYAIRFTLGKQNTEEDIDKLLEKLPPIIERIRKMNPLYENSN